MNESEKKDRESLIEIMRAFPQLSVEEVERLIRNAFRSLYPKK
jgi:hypothetical protein